MARVCLKLHRLLLAFQAHVLVAGHRSLLRCSNGTARLHFHTHTSTQLGCCAAKPKQEKEGKKTQARERNEGIQVQSAHRAPLPAQHTTSHLTQRQRPLKHHCTPPYRCAAAHAAYSAHRGTITQPRTGDGRRTGAASSAACWFALLLVCAVSALSRHCIGCMGVVRG